MAGISRLGMTGPMAAYAPFTAKEAFVGGNVGGTHLMLTGCGRLWWLILLRRVWL